MLSDGPPRPLLGRRSECDTLDQLLEAVRGGSSAVVVLVGEPGIGKTALLEYTVASASGFQVARGLGVESEMELAFAALQQLCAPILDRIGRLPDHQSHALAVAFGLEAGDPPDRFLVGLAVLNLLADAAEERPLLCVVDDAQWLDRSSAQALGFVARRLLADSVGLVFATRESSPALRGLPEMAVEGLGGIDARRLLGTAIKGPLDERVRDRFVAETHGNPLALVEIPSGLDPAELAGGFGTPHLLPLAGRIEGTFQQRLGTLPAETQQLLLLAAADPVGDPLVLWRAAEWLGIGDSAADAAEAAGLLEVGARVVFRHPLVRSAAYHAASPEEQREVHRALAETIDPKSDPDRRAWHRARATSRPDEGTAAELERSAERARARGGLAAAAAFLERAVALTIDPAKRAERALAAARANQEAGALPAALALLATAESGPLGEFGRAQVDVVRAQISFAASRGADTGPLLLSAAKRVEPLDVRLAREIYLDALLVAVYTGHLGEDRAAIEAAHAARAAEALPSPRAVDLILDGLALAITDGPPAGLPILREALIAFCSDGLSNEERLRWLGSAAHVAQLMWNHEAWKALSARAVEDARNQGALRALPVVLTSLSGVHLFAGDLAMATSLVEQVDAVTEVTGDTVGPYSAVSLAGFRGREAEAAKIFEAATAEFSSRGEAEGLTVVRWATAVLYNGLGRYEEALAAGVRAAAESHEMWFARWGLVDLIEAAARTEDVDLAQDALDRLARHTAAVGTDWALGIEARSRALVSTGEAAEELYRAAIDALERTGARVELARARLLYGEWLRRERRRIDARAQLRTAHELFSEFGMEAFAERARAELSATGEHARKRTFETRDDLTPQEANISRLVADGATNREIAAQLFISSSTVDYHLQKVFRKLGVRSRTQLARHLLQRRERGELAARQP